MIATQEYETVLEGLKARRLPYRHHPVIEGMREHARPWVEQPRRERECLSIRLEASIGAPVPTLGLQFLGEMQQSLALA